MRHPSTLSSIREQGGAAVEPVGRIFPSAVVDGEISRPRLSSCVMGKPEALRRLEEVVHPLVGAERDDFVRQASGVCAICA